MEAYCRVTPEFIAFSSRSLQITQDSIRAAMEDGSDILVKEAQAGAPWNQAGTYENWVTTGKTRDSIKAVVTVDANTAKVFLVRGDSPVSGYVAAMERGIIGGWGRGPSVKSWTPPGEVIEVTTMIKFFDVFMARVKTQFREQFHRRIGSYRGGG